MAKKKVTVIINEDIHSTVKKIAVDKDKKISDVYEEILLEGLRIISNQSNLEDYKTDGVKTEVETE
jgi:uncharacterized linocin/CFP29 family protein